MVRGKYAARLKESADNAAFDPEMAEDIRAYDEAKKAIAEGEELVPSEVTYAFLDGDDRDHENNHTSWPEPDANDDLRPENDFDCGKARLNRFTGQVDPMRLGDQFVPGDDDHTAERDELFRDMTLDDMIAGIKQRREQTVTELRQVER
jgi:hypothetical protein